MQTLRFTAHSRTLARVMRALPRDGRPVGYARILGAVDHDIAREPVQELIDAGRITADFNGDMMTYARA